MRKVEVIKKQRQNNLYFLLRMRCAEFLRYGTRPNAAAAALAGLFLSAFSFAPSVSATPYATGSGRRYHRSRPGLSSWRDGAGFHYGNFFIDHVERHGDLGGPERRFIKSLWRAHIHLLAGIEFHQSRRRQQNDRGRIQRIHRGCQPRNLTGGKVAPGDTRWSGTIPNNGDTLRFNWAAAGLAYPGDTGAWVLRYVD